MLSRLSRGGYARLHARPEQDAIFCGICDAMPRTKYMNIIAWRARALDTARREAPTAIRMGGTMEQLFVVLCSVNDESGVGCQRCTMRIV